MKLISDSVKANDDKMGYRVEGEECYCRLGVGVGGAES